MYWLRGLSDIENAAQAIRFWLAYHTGSLNTSGAPPNYNFWSGFGSDLTEFALVGGIWRMLNCHEKGCYRPGFRYKGHVVCHKHRGKIE